MKPLETPRLVLRRLTLDDADFILRLVNEPAWLQFIGDRGVRSLDDARAYLRKGPLALYDRFGFGPLRVERRSEAGPIGICGLIKRDTLPDVDLGFAYFPEFWGQGYAYEAAAAVLQTAVSDYGLTRVVALTALENPRSIRLLEKLGLRFERIIRVTPDAPDSRLFGLQLPGGR